MEWNQGVDKFRSYLLKLKKTDNIWLIHHADCDGCVAAVFCSYVIKRLGLRLTKRLWVLSSEYDLQFQKELIRQYSPQVVIFLDLDVVSDGVLLGDWKNKVERILIYDHHKVDDSELKKLLSDHKDIFYLNPRLLPQAHTFPASYFGYSLFRKFQTQDSRIWLMGAGLIGDHALDEDQELKEIILKEYRDLIKSGYDTNSSLSQITFMINAGYFHCDSKNNDVSYQLAYEAFLQNNPSIFFDFRIPLARELQRRKSGVDIAVRQACISAENNSIQDESLPLVIYIIESQHYISGLVASSLSSKYKNEIILVGQAWQDKFSFEIRRGINCSIDITQILKLQRNYYTSLSAGGHPPACGALVMESDRDRFINTFREAFLNLYAQQDRGRIYR